MSASIPSAGATVIQEPMRAGTRATRGVDFSALFTISGDVIASIAGIVVRRVDGLSIGANDLTVTPADYTAPWVGANAKGVPNTLVGWWQSCGPAIATPEDVPYQISVFVNTTGGALIGGDVLQVVTAALGFGILPVIGPTPPSSGEIELQDGSGNWLFEDGTTITWG